MATTLAFEPTCANTAAAEFIEHLTCAVQLVIDTMADTNDFALPARLTVILADDFTGEVDRRMAAAPGTPPFSTDRVGGTVAAKNLPVPGDPDAGYIVVNAGSFDYADTSCGGQLVGAYAMTHELFHPPLTWTRNASGALDGYTGPASTPAECARAILRTISDEFRADLLASQALRALARGDVGQLRLADGREQWLHEQHIESLNEALDDVIHPGWPDTVLSYRTYDIDLETMWRTIVSQTEQALTLLAHADASAINAGHPFALTGNRAEHLGTTTYLADVWHPIRDFLIAKPVLPGLAHFADIERDLLAIGEPAIMSMWGKLGLTFEETGGGGFHLHVTDPQ